MGQIKIGCEMYTWLMAGDQYENKFDHMIQIAAKAGFQGIEPIDKNLGNYFDAGKLSDELQASGITLSSVCLLEEWLYKHETEIEKATADKIIDFLKTYFPSTMLMLCQNPTKRDDQTLVERQDNLISCINSVAKRAAEHGIKCSYHPNSPKESIWRTEEEYKELLPRLDASVIGWTPDVGHLAKGGIDPITTMIDFKELINHVHFKDIDNNGNWTLIGRGKINFIEITKNLIANNFNGWLILEDECDEAISDPDNVTYKCGEYATAKLFPLVTDS